MDIQFKDLDIAKLCCNLEIPATVELSREDDKCVVKTPMKYGQAMRPKLVSVCRTASALVDGIVVYAEEAYPDHTILTFSVVQ